MYAHYVQPVKFVEIHIFNLGLETFMFDIRQYFHVNSMPTNAEVEDGLLHPVVIKSGPAPAPEGLLFCHYTLNTRIYVLISDRF